MGTQGFSLLTTFVTQNNSNNIDHILITLYITPLVLVLQLEVCTFWFSSSSSHYSNSYHWKPQKKDLLLGFVLFCFLTIIDLQQYSNSCHTIQ